MTIQPLTRHNLSGELYQRTQQVETQIREVLEISPEALVERARIRDYQAAGYLQEECLVYLIREHHRAGHCGLVNDLATVLVDRTAKIATPNLRSLGSDLAGDAFQDVIAKLFMDIWDLQSDKADYAQVRFRVYVGRIVTSEFRRYCKQLVNQTSFVIDDELDSLGDLPARDCDTVEEIGVVLADLDAAMPGLSTIDEPCRTAFILRYYSDWPIEHKDPEIPTISRYFNCDPRTIRNWLKKADKALEAWRGARV